MNKQEAIEKIEGAFMYKVTSDLGICVNRQDVIDIVNQINEPEKPAIPQTVMDYYVFYKGKLSSFTEWFAEFKVVSDEDFQQMDEVHEWLYDVDFELQQQRELALATLIVNGPDAVEVEREKLYTVELPNPNGKSPIRKYGLVKNDDHNVVIGFSERLHQFTESEIRKDFEWAWQFAKEAANE